MVEKVNILEETSRNRSCPGKKIKGKVPKRIHKAEREKMKREHLNELFSDIANAFELCQQTNGRASILCETTRLLKDFLELCQQTNGRASILCETTRLLKDFLGQIESLKKENASLLSESLYVAMEKIELKEENSALETQIQELQGEIEGRVAQSIPDLNIPPLLELQPPEQTSIFPGDSLQLPTVEPSPQQGPAVLVVPFRPHLQASFSAPNIAELTSKPTCIVSKPHARYPTPADTWPLQLLGEQQTSSKKC